MLVTGQLLEMTESALSPFSPIATPLLTVKHLKGCLAFSLYFLISSPTPIWLIKTHHQSLHQNKSKVSGGLQVNPSSIYILNRGNIVTKAAKIDSREQNILDIKIVWGSPKSHST